MNFEFSVWIGSLGGKKMRRSFSLLCCWQLNVMNGRNAWNRKILIKILTCSVSWINPHGKTPWLLIWPWLGGHGYALVGCGTWYETVTNDQLITADRRSNVIMRWGGGGVSVRFIIRIRRGVGCFPWKYISWIRTAFLLQKFLDTTNSRFKNFHPFYLKNLFCRKQNRKFTGQELGLLKVGNKIWYKNMLPVYNQSFRRSTKAFCFSMLKHLL